MADQSAAFFCIKHAMAEDYYKTLDVPRDASAADIQKAYRTLARKYHPDLHPDDKTAKKKFQEVQTAFDVLNDPSKRELYDRYGSSFDKMGAGGGSRGGYAGGGQAAPGFEDIDFSQFFGERFGGGGGGDEGGGFAEIFKQFGRGGGSRSRKPKAAARSGEDVRAEISIPFNTAVLGGQTELSIQRGGGKVETLAVKIPAGVADGGKIRLRGQGEPGPGGGPAGDILLTVHVAPHPYFQRRGNDLDVKVPVTLSEAVLGAKVDVPTPGGVITLRVPPRTSSGAKLRAKGRGVAPKNGESGDLYAEIQIMLPKEIDAETLAAIERLGSGSHENPRADLRW